MGERDEVDEMFSDGRCCDCPVVLTGTRQDLGDCGGCEAFIQRGSLGRLVGEEKKEEVAVGRLGPVDKFFIRLGKTVRMMDRERQS